MLNNNNNASNYDDDDDYHFSSTTTKQQHQQYPNQENEQEQLLLLMNRHYNQHQQQEKWISSPAHHELGRGYPHTTARTPVVQFYPFVEICPIASPLDQFYDDVDDIVDDPISNINNSNNNNSNNSNMINDLWYCPNELDEMRYDAREKVRYLRRRNKSMQLSQSGGNTTCNTASSSTTTTTVDEIISKNESNLTNRIETIPQRIIESDFCYYPSLSTSSVSMTDPIDENDTTADRNSIRGGIVEERTNISSTSFTPVNRIDEYPLLALCSETRGLEHRICTVRQKRRFLTIQLIVSVCNKRRTRQRTMTNSIMCSDNNNNNNSNDDTHDSLPSSSSSSQDSAATSRTIPGTTNLAVVPSSDKLAAFFSHCSMWATKLAIEEASRDYIRAYKDDCINSK